MIHIKPPTPVPNLIKHMVFLAGSIEMGSAIDWQFEVVSELIQYDIIVANPRREYWDSNWVQSIKNPDFSDQVNWELDNITNADMVIFNFVPHTLSPISLLELGVVSRDSQNVLVCCPDGFWRKGNVEVVCDRSNIPVYNDMQSLMKEAHKIIKRGFYS